MPPPADPRLSSLLSVVNGRAPSPTLYAARGPLDEHAAPVSAPALLLLLLAVIAAAALLISYRWRLLSCRRRRGGAAAPVDAPRRPPVGWSVLALVCGGVATLVRRTFPTPVAHPSPALVPCASLVMVVNTRSGNGAGKVVSDIAHVMREEEEAARAEGGTRKGGGEPALQRPFLAPETMPLSVEGLAHALRRVSALMRLPTTGGAAQGGGDSPSADGMVARVGDDSCPGGVGVRLVCAGGDGTVSAIARTLAARGLTAAVPIAVLPLGTGNDVARSVGLAGRPPPLDPPSLAAFFARAQSAPALPADIWGVSFGVHPAHRGGSVRVLRHGVETLLPETEVRGTGLLYVSVGLDARLVWEVEQRRSGSRWVNKLLYFLIGARLIVCGLCAVGISAMRAQLSWVLRRGRGGGGVMLHDGAGVEGVSSPHRCVMLREGGHGGCFIPTPYAPVTQAMQTICMTGGSERGECSDSTPTASTPQHRRLLTLPSLQSLIALNMGSYAGGTNLWPAAWTLSPAAYARMTTWGSGTSSGASSGAAGSHLVHAPSRLTRVWRALLFHSRPALLAPLSALVACLRRPHAVLPLHAAHTPRDDAPPLTSARQDMADGRFELIGSSSLFAISGAIGLRCGILGGLLRLGQPSALSIEWTDSSTATSTWSPRAEGGGGDSDRVDSGGGRGGGEEEGEEDDEEDDTGEGEEEELEEGGGYPPPHPAIPPPRRTMRHTLRRVVLAAGALSARGGLRFLSHGRIQVRSIRRRIVNRLLATHTPHPPVCATPELMDDEESGGSGSSGDADAARQDMAPHARVRGSSLSGSGPAPLHARGWATLHRGQLLPSTELPVQVIVRGGSPPQAVTAGPSPHPSSADEHMAAGVAPLTSPPRTPTPPAFVSPSAHVAVGSAGMRSRGSASRPGQLNCTSPEGASNSGVVSSAEGGDGVYGGVDEGDEGGEDVPPLVVYVQVDGEAYKLCNPAFLRIVHEGRVLLVSFK